jgi:hypothetical protein
MDVNTLYTRLKEILTDAEAELGIGPMPDGAGPLVKEAMSALEFAVNNIAKAIEMSSPPTGAPTPKADEPPPPYPPPVQEGTSTPA